MQRGMQLLLLSQAALLRGPRGAVQAPRSLANASVQGASTGEHGAETCSGTCMGVDHVIELACADPAVPVVTCDLLRTFRVCGSCKGPGIQRFGEPKDGGYLMCQELAAPAAAMSFGINGFDGWGDSYANRYQVPVHQYDCFNQKVPACPSHRCHFHPICVQDAGPGPSFKPLSVLMDQVAPGGEVTVKMDVEQAEWGAIRSTDDAHLTRMRQFVLEFHGLGNQARHAEFLAVMQKLSAHFTVVHTHGNNCCPARHFGKYVIPNTFEVSLVRKDLATAGACVDTQFRPGMDAANTPKKPERVPVRLPA